jgi:Fur family transcriptional regulator, ferric uptake regulator
MWYILLAMRMPKSDSFRKFRRARNQRGLMLADARDRLQRRHLRATAPRLAVLRLLLRERRPLSHSQVAQALHSDGFDRATVFRNLRDLAEAAILTRVDVGDHTWRFELHADHNSSRTHHSHFVCERCSAVRCLDDFSVHTLSHTPALGAIVASVSEVVLRGCCKHC